MWFRLEAPLEISKKTACTCARQRLDSRHSFVRQYTSFFSIRQFHAVVVEDHTSPHWQVLPATQNQNNQRGDHQKQQKVGRNDRTNEGSEESEDETYMKLVPAMRRSAWRTHSSTSGLPSSVRYAPWWQYADFSESKGIVNIDNLQKVQYKFKRRRGWISKSENKSSYRWWWWRTTTGFCRNLSFSPSYNICKIGIRSSAQIEKEKGNENTRDQEREPHHADVHLGRMRISEKCLGDA